MPPFFSVDSFKIAVSSSEPGREPTVIFENGSRFEIPRQGVYALVGPNRSGKSLLIRMIMGALPPEVTTGEPRLHLNGEPCVVKRVKDAHRFGIITVFQSDELISTMTVREQLILRHCRPRLRNFLANISNRFVKWLKGFFTYGAPADLAAEAISEFSPPHDLAEPKAKLFREIHALIKAFQLTDDILDELPQKLSGGTRARVKLISALLTPNIRLLFLDEALGGVDEANSAHLVRWLRKNAEERNYGLVVVTHDSKERARWRPNGEFHIEGKRIRFEDFAKANSVEAPLVLPERIILKFTDLESARDYLANLAQPVIAFVDDGCKNQTQVTRLLGMLPLGKKIIPVSITESTKSLDEFKTFSEANIGNFPKAEGTIVIVGGGVVINFCSQFAAMVHRGAIPHVVVPTTVMSLADVAIGSKASLNVVVAGSGIARKHVLGTYANPCAIVCDPGLLSSLDVLQIKLGLSEVLKHALLQDAELYRRTCELLLSINPDRVAVYECALKVQEMKGHLLSLDPLEIKDARILLHGHLHAHNLERFSNFSISHGLAVLLGITLDAMLDHPPQTPIVDKLVGILRQPVFSAQIKLVTSFLSTPANLQDLKAVYEAEARVQFLNGFDRYSVISVPSVGCYDTQPLPLIMKDTKWESIHEAITQLIKRLD